ncbi:MAG: mannose-1-phosphate guanylyltransferase, partial [Oligoflexia bacterium]|nr:mannose-1-phosphate guanylyltransferase [Oligoflexia bacterium]
MEKINYYALIMAGGSGRRFWPESTKDRPKQYLNLASEKTLLEETLLRFEGLVDKSHRYIVTIKEQEALAKKYSSGLGLMPENNLILEPLARNTAPCIFLSLITLIKAGAKKNDMLIIAPSDHVILNKDAFKKDFFNALKVAEKNSSIVTIGIKPNFPHTGYGYIKTDAVADAVADADAHKVKEFKEKPHFELAKEYISKGYYWNAGMFVASIETLLREFETHSPEIYKFYHRLGDLNLNQKEQLKTEYQLMPSISIDYAILEKSTRVNLIAANFDWSDLGSWETLSDVCKDKDKKNENYLVANNDRFFIDDKSSNNIVRVEKEKLVV